VIVGADYDGVLSRSRPLDPEPTLCITGRTWEDYDESLKKLASEIPVYIRGNGRYGDAAHAARFKATMIDMLGVDVFYEDDPEQAALIELRCPTCKVVLIR
jgi:hypothetical protein